VKVGVIYRRLQEWGITRSNSQSHFGIKPSNHRGGYIEKRSGYKIVIIPNDSPYASMAIMNRESGALYVREHRLVVAQNIGRPLESWEVVHHVNHNRLDNRIENLQVFESQSQHQAETITHNYLLKLKKENEEIRKIINGCEGCRAALLAVTEAR
jgi:hypothetical protein